jgi:hypothetical protein
MRHPSQNVNLNVYETGWLFGKGAPLGQARMRRNPEGDAVVLPDMLAPVYKATATITSGLAGLFLHPPTGSPSSGPDT